MMSGVAELVSSLFLQERPLRKPTGAGTCGSLKGLKRHQICTHLWCKGDLSYLALLRGLKGIMNDVSNIVYVPGFWKANPSYCLNLPACLRVLKFIWSQCKPIHICFGFDCLKHICMLKHDVLAIPVVFDPGGVEQGLATAPYCCFGFAFQSHEKKHERAPHVGLSKEVLGLMGNKHVCSGGEEALARF